MDQHSVAARLRKHLLLFYREGSPPDLSDEARRQLSHELEAWGKRLETRGEMVFMADVLPGHATSWLGRGAGGELGPAERPELPVDLVGVCIIRARDRASALEAARRSPHVGQGGLVAVHEIDSL